MSELAKLPKDLRSAVLDYVGRWMYPSLSIYVRIHSEDIFYTVSMYGDSFKVVRDRLCSLNSTEPCRSLDGTEPFTFFISCRDLLLEVLHRKLNGDLGTNETDSLPWLSMSYDGFADDESMIHEIISDDWPSDRPHLEKSTLKHMVDLLGVLYVIV